MFAVRTKPLEQRPVAIIVHGKADVRTECNGRKYFPSPLKQDPLLKRAGKIFATITLGSYVGLTVDYDGDRPLLKGLRSNGKHVGVEGLSSGTRDQLFLALRIAALEQHLS